MPPAFLVIEQIAALIGVPVSRVRTWARDVGPDSLPCYRPGKRYLFDEGEVLQWIKTHYRKKTLAAVPGPRRRVLVTPRRRTSSSRIAGRGGVLNGQDADGTRVSASSEGPGLGPVALEVPQNGA